MVEVEPETHETVAAAAAVTAANASHVRAVQLHTIDDAFYIAVVSNANELVYDCCTLCASRDPPSRTHTFLSTTATEAATTTKTTTTTMLKTVL